MSFKRIQDQSVALRLLRNLVRRKRIPNGLLFWGPDGVGKRLAAWEFAKAVNCMESDDDACDTCLSCRKIEHRNHTDVMLITPTGKMRIIRESVITELNDLSAYRPFDSGRRIVLIEDADRMNETAQNKFLKTLEEPPSDTTFILISGQPRFLLPTIQSRCQRVRFGVLSTETIASLLKQHSDVDGAKRPMFAALAGGSVARALELTENKRLETVLHVILSLAKGEDPLALSEQFGKYIQETEKSIAKQVQETQRGSTAPDEEETAPDKDAIDAHIAGLVRREMIEHLVLFDAWYRDELVHSVVPDAPFIHYLGQTSHFSKEVCAHRCAVRLKAISEAWMYIERNLNKQRIFRDLFFVLSAP
ncbi:MAG: DNA polymerase III subunit delta' [Candidatus Hydrogenedentes bacterium]|nr:DNA polymerase III subunit delta' [Candidatus Hydrogenedentota bacterium]